MTRVSTSFGEVYAQALRERDMVRTKSGEFLPIKSIARVILDAEYLGYHPEAQPILIHAGAIAQGIPAADILLAPGQPIHKAQRFGSSTVERAIDAINKPRVFRKAEPMITYTVIRFDRPATVCCEGLWLDFLPGETVDTQPEFA